MARRSTTSNARAESQLFGVADPVSEGSIASGEFQQLGEGEGDGDEHERLADRFSLLREILEQITQESGVALVALEVRPQPPVPRCSYLMIEHEKSRCYLLARFKLQNGDQRYLLEIDTSDNRKTMSTRIMGFKAGVKAGKCIDRILRETVKSSLRWRAPWRSTVSLCTLRITRKKAHLGPTMPGCSTGSSGYTRL